MYESRFVERYAEYWVARQLQLKGHEVQILKDRQLKTADIYLPRSATRVEVKSAWLNDDGHAYASFGMGTQVKREKFDYCVFLIFSSKRTENPKDVFVFSRNEVQEVAVRRLSLSKHPDSNPCLLMFAGSLKEYRRRVKEWHFMPFKIEIRLHRTPGQFRNRWSKIK